MSPHLRRVCTVLATALVGALISCTAVRKGNFTIVDLGGAVNNIGLAEPHLREEPLPPGRKPRPPHISAPDSDIRIRVWKKDERYLIQLPITYLPARSPLIYNTRYSKRRSMAELQQELRSYPTEYFYAEMAAHTYRQLLRIRKYVRTKDLRNIRILTADEVSLADWEPLLDVHGNEPAPQGVPHIHFYRSSFPVPDRCTWYHYCLTPISIGAHILDIPLSIIATPIGWLAYPEEETK